MTTFPTVHLYGTSKEKLLSQQIENLEALRNAIETLSRNSPHARDFYVQEDAAIYAAVREHTKRVQTLEAVMAEIQQIAENIADQSNWNGKA